ncbi:thioredoxin domain-containing protein [Chitinispirillales bacterium ANBcel5]|uniref:thioredoxin domain-containing protein n=1 Tax=Cellulosispirillum alkaliphilum TaxID=3039283 RepID=UPI002A572121|nr:thioredoxin domain-containing protein [Chitinispirillales bacterium ANBcel5]
MNFFHLNRKRERPEQNNRLINEKSPYLLQHAHNPVDWHPWGEEAFRKARTENKPIFLSIGYSTCHWCHVMEKESFNDPEVADLMNESFVSVKVDREERPDLDDLYMYVCQIITGGGGWPLTVMMTPDKLPFFAATYIPRESSGNFIGLTELIPQINELWNERNEDLASSAQQFAVSLKMFSSTPEASFNDEELLEETFSQLEGQYDKHNGGFGDAPKFPSPQILLFLLRYWKLSGEQKALSMVEKTLSEMRKGGIYDQIGYGFHRYSTDSSWKVPHFEKMLYDQAMLTISYTEAFQATGNEEYKRTAEQIISYVLRDLRSPEGAFYCAEDSDSDGKEGKFYTWSSRESSEVLDKEDIDLAFKAYGINERGNVEDTDHEYKGLNILNRHSSPEHLLSEFDISEDELNKRLEKIRNTMFSVRVNRIRPQKDDKILSDWNGLMIAALAKASRAFSEPSYLQAAKEACDFIMNNIHRPSDGFLMHRWREGEAAIAGYADDYAFMTWALLEIYECDFDANYFGKALQLNNYMLEHFWDSKNGGFFTSPDYGEQLLIRRKEIYDDAYPSANSIAFQNQLIIGKITAKPEYDDLVAQMKKAFSGEIVRAPSLFTFLIMNFQYPRGQEVIIAGNPNNEDTKQMISELNHEFLPYTVTVLKPSDQQSPEIVKYVDFLKDYNPRDGKTTAFVCTDHSCKPPTTDVQEVLGYLRAA